MIKKFVLVCMGMILSLSVMAQVTANRADGNTDQQTSFTGERGAGFVMKYGVKAGVNMTSMSNDMAFDPGFGMGIGFRGGVFLNMRWGQRTENSLPGTGLWGFQPEILFSYQTAKTDAGDVKMNTISVPLLLKVYPTTAFSIEVGPEFSYLLSTSPETMEFNSQTNGIDKVGLAVGDCSGLIMGLAAGVAYDLPVGLTVGARYTYGFTDMAKNLKWKSSAIQATVGWMF